MSTHENISQGVTLRHKVDITAEKDVAQAYELAKSIKHPWYKCQALAKVADHTSKTAIQKVLQESFDSAMNCHDQNRRVSVACYPIGIAIKHSLKELARSFLEQCINQLNQEMDPISKWCAARVVYAIKTDDALLRRFFSTFVNATSKGHGWRVEREIRFMLSDHDIQKDQRYISYLIERQNAIAKWKIEHK